MTEAARSRREIFQTFVQRLFVQVWSRHEIFQTFVQTLFVQVPYVQVTFIKTPLRVVMKWNFKKISLGHLLHVDVE